MNWDSFFTDGDKPYSENLNDSLMLLDAFDVTVPCSMPDMFNNGDFSSSVNVTRKCGVALVTLKSVDSGITVGTDEISGTGTVVFRVYPNFNSFYKWSKIILEKSGTVAIGFKKADGTDITVTVASDGTIGDAAALKMLEEIDVVLTLDNASISNILIWFVNNQSNRTRTGALLEASQLTNVNGTVSDGETKAVNGGTVYTALDELETSLSEDISDLDTAKEDVSNKVTSLDSSDTHYPSAKAVKTVTDGLSSSINSLSNSKEDVSNKVATLDTNASHYPSCTAVNTGLNGKENTSNRVTSLDNSSSHYPTTSAIQPLLKAITELITVSTSRNGNNQVVLTSNVTGLKWVLNTGVQGTTTSKTQTLSPSASATSITLSFQGINVYSGNV